MEWDTQAQKHPYGTPEAVTVSGHRSPELYFLVLPYPRAMSTKRE
ncbi:hypothetical protein GCM10027580_14190 [Corynebacterium faecale]